MKVPLNRKINQQPTNPKFYLRKVPLPVKPCKFGKNLHPTLKDVYENNNGIDFSCSAGASVRSVFEGEVSSVFSIAGAGKVIIIKHGNYRSVYSNLSAVTVTVGQIVSTKQALGTLLSEDNISILHFEIHSVSGINTTPLNPSLWLSR
ncbi:MAG: M23 family metallopeptidase [Flavobacteriia bacterium]|nr:M23 family metallopeptidase [Flavobacteriia bacterium]